MWLKSLIWDKSLQWKVEVMHFYSLHGSRSIKRWALHQWAPYWCQEEGREERGTHCISYYHLLILWYLASGAEFYLLYFEALLSQFHNVMYSSMRALERHILLEYRVQHGHDVPLCYFLCIANKVSLFSPFFVFFVLSIAFLLFHVSDMLVVNHDLVLTLMSSQTSDEQKLRFLDKT